jgi:hypothetical protein
MRILIGTACAVAGLVAGCDRSTGGEAPRTEASTPSTTTSSTTSTAVSTTKSGLDAPGVTETQHDTIPPNALVCSPTAAGAGTPTQATVSDPVAPRLTISIPASWTSSPGTGDVALTLAGPDGMSGSVAIATTTLDPAAAFKKYADDVAAKADFSSINLRPADFCGYSGQQLFGTLSDPPGPATYFADRIAHIWTNTKNYLVAIHLQGPKEDAGFDEAKTALMQDFAVVIP